MRAEGSREQGSEETVAGAEAEEKREQLSALRSASWRQDTGTGCSPELKHSTSSSQGPLTNS